MRILVVEDFAPLRAALARGLEREGYEPEECADGSSGLARALARSHRLIVLDAMLPGLDGFEFLRRFRSEGMATPILMLTARDALSDRVAGLESGADDYMVKPFAFAELLARIRALLRRGGETANGRVGDLEIDVVRRVATRAGDAIGLTPREFAVLEFLVGQQGKLVSRDDIHQRIYPDSGFATSNVVEVLVGSLRRKLEEGGRSRLLHTRRGFGYVLQADPC